jgi:outer membrane cobalamin receptor
VANDFNPMYELANRKINQDRNRFSGSSRLRWRMLDWLSGEGSLAYDQEAQTYSDVVPFGYLTSSGTKTQGSLVKDTRNNWQLNTGVTLTGVRRFGDITNTTKVGTSFEDQENNLLSDSAGAFVVGGVPEFGGVNRGTVRIGSREERIRSQSYYATTAFDIKDRYIVDGLVRRDGSSLFGPESRYATYYRVSGAWRVTEDMRIPGVDELRLRASYGTAGLRPNFDDQYEILAVTAGGFTTEILGNPLLKPARSAELEVGTNLEFGGGRYTAEYTYARKNTTDQILLVDLSAVARSATGTGGFKQQWQNTGALRSNTHEVTSLLG